MIDGIIKEGMEIHNKAVTAMEEMPNGSVRAALKQLIQELHNELILAGNLDEQGKSVKRVVIRIGDLFSKFKAYNI